MSSRVQPPGVEPPGGYEMTLNNGNIPGSASSSVTGDSVGTSGVPETLNLTVVLPNGDARFVTVDSGKQMMDLMVQLAASNKISPAGHTIQIYPEDAENGDRPVDYQPSQTLASIYAHSGPVTLCLVPKRLDFQIEKKSRENSRMANQPFEKTRRLTVNLPHNQKTVLRISPKSSMTATLQAVCREKNLNPAAHELRHPGQPELDLRPDSTLQDFGLNEINLVLLDGTEPRLMPSASVPAQTRDVGRSHSESNMSAKQQKEDDYTSGYMPGMEPKKKKGFFSKIFSRKKGDSFKIPEATHRSGAPPSRALSSSQGSLHKAGTLSMPPAQTNNHHLQSQPPPPQQQQRQQQQQQQQQRASTVVPAKPPRKKRPAPPPPTVKPTVVVVAEPAGQPEEDEREKTQEQDHALRAQTVEVVQHSRTSSHSSGFAEGDVSPLGSPSSGSRQNQGVPVEAVTVMTQPAVVAVQKELTSSGSESGSLPRTNQKKRRAPLPPGMAGKTISPEVPPPAVTVADQDSKGGSTLDSHAPDSLSDSPSKSRPCLFIPPPPPDSPPPDRSSSASNVTARVGEQEQGESIVSDSSTQVHVSVRDSLSSECEYGLSRSSSISSTGSSCTQECMGSLVVQSAEGSTSNTQHVTNSTDPGQKSDLAMFVDQMGELTESAYQEEEHEDQQQEEEEDTAVTVNSSDTWDSGVTIKNKEEDSTVSVIRIGNFDSGHTELQDTLQAFDNIENEEDHHTQSNSQVEEITLEAQHIEDQKDNFVSLISVGGDVETVEVVETKTSPKVSPSKSSDGEISLEEISFDQTEVVYVAPTVNSPAPAADHHSESSDSTEVVFFSEDGQNWDTPAQPEIEVEQDNEVVKSQKSWTDSGPIEGEDFVHVPEDDNDMPNAYTVSVTREYVISHKPGEFDYPPLPESAKKAKEPEQAPRIKSLREAYRKSTPEPLPARSEEDDIGYNDIEPIVYDPPSNFACESSQNVSETLHEPAWQEQPSSIDFGNSFGDDSAFEQVTEDPEPVNSHVDVTPLPVVEEQIERTVVQKKNISVDPFDTSLAVPYVPVMKQRQSALHRKNISADRADSKISSPPRPVAQEQEQTEAAAHRKNISVDAESPTRKTYRFWAPRPYGSRAKSEPNVKDVRSALQTHQEKVNSEPVSTDFGGNVETTTTQISSSPRRHDVLTVTKSEGADEPQEGTYFQKYGIVRTTRSTDNVAQSKEKAKKSLQSQYADLQAQFARWQQNLQDNQNLLSSKDILQDFSTPSKHALDRSASFAGTSPEPEEVAPKTTVTKVPKSILKGSSKVEKPPEASPKPRSPPVAAKPPPSPTKHSPVKPMTVATHEEPRHSSPIPEPVVVKPPQAPKAILIEQNEDKDAKGYAEDLVSARSRLRANAPKDKMMCIRFNADGTKSRVFKKSVTETSAPRSPRQGHRPMSRVYAPASHNTASPTTVSATPVAPPPPSTNTAIVNNNNNNNPIKSVLKTSSSSTSSRKVEPKLDPREDLMLAIRSAGGRQALRRVQVSQIHWSKA